MLHCRHRHGLVVDRFAAAAFTFTLQVFTRFNQCLRPDEIDVVVLGGRHVTGGGGGPRDDGTALCAWRRLIETQVQVLDLTRFLGWRRCAVEVSLQILRLCNEKCTWYLTAERNGDVIEHLIVERNDDITEDYYFIVWAFPSMT